MGIQPPVDSVEAAQKLLKGANFEKQKMILSFLSLKVLKRLDALCQELRRETKLRIMSQRHLAWVLSWHKKETKSPSGTVQT